MATLELTKEDLWDLSVGGSVFSTGGGGAGPTREQFDTMVDAALATGVTPRLITVDEVPDDAVVFMGTGAGGGVTREEKEKWLSGPGWRARFLPGYNQNEFVRARIRELEHLYPLCDWSEVPGADWMGAAEKRLTELVGKEPFAYLAFEIGPNAFNSVLTAAARGKALVDGDTAGHRAVPETSQNALNIIGAPLTPVVLTTAWGDLIVYEKLLSYQRMEDMNRALAATSGGSVSAQAAVSGATLKRGGVVAGTFSRARRVGRAVREALAAGRDPVDAAVAAAEGYLLFRGRILAQVNEDKHAFIWGDEYFEGTGAYRGHTFRIWYKNENHMSWLDGKPYVMSPDIITVLDARTGIGLSNFATWDWTWGREVAVVGIPCAPMWRTERGLRIFHPQRWGFACEYIPIEEAVRARAVVAV
jgi:DUF917 family protein